MPAPPPDCATELRRLYDAIMALSSGERVVGINYGDRSVQYGPEQLPNLQMLYRMFYRQCGATSGLVDLSAPAATRRGPPAVRSIN